MKRTQKPDPQRWKKDVYVGWVPWRFIRWWAANKLWVIASIIILPVICLLLTGIVGLLVSILLLMGSGATKVIRDRRRGIGFTKNNEIVIFGPHAPIVIPSSEIQSLGVMKASRLLAFNLQSEDAEILPDQDKWYQRMFSYAGFKSEAPIRAKDAAAAREMSLASGRGLLVVVRDKQGTFWTVSTGAGYEVATLRDLAALAKVRFVSPGDPFGRRPAPNRNPKRQQTKKVNKARVGDLPDRDLLKGYGIHQLRSPGRLQAFINANTCFRNGALPEEWIPEIGLQVPTEEEMKKSRRRVRLYSGVTGLTVFFLIIVGPVIGMSVWPVTTGGILTSSWPRPYERIWETPQGWTAEEGTGDLLTLVQDGSPESVVTMQVADTDLLESSCDLILQDTAFSFFAESEEAIPETPPEVVGRDNWKSIQITPDRSLWCQEETVGESLRFIVAEAENVTTDEAYVVVSSVKTRLNV